MSRANENVTDLHTDAPPISANFGGGSGTDARLAAVESRLAALEAHFQHLATKEDIQTMQVGMLKWGTGILILATSLACAIVIVAFTLFG